jgi:hypothetical protein
VNELASKTKRAWSLGPFVATASFARLSACHHREANAHRDERDDVGFRSPKQVDLHPFVK